MATYISLQWYQIPAAPFPDGVLDTVDKAQQIRIGWPVSPPPTQAIGRTDKLRFPARKRFVFPRIST